MSHMMLRCLLMGSIAMVATPAFADTTAVYRAPTGTFEMTVEVATNGNIRGKVKGQNAYFVTRSNEGFMVLSTSKGVVVDRIADIGIAMREAFSAFIAKNPGLAEAGEEVPQIDLVESGTVVVKGRTGRAYFFGGQAGKPEAQPIAVISNDPALAELGHALSRQFAMSTKMMQPMPGAAGFASKMQSILESGAALTFGGGELISVSNAPISPARFAIPGPPESVEQVRIRFKASGGHIP